MVFRDVLDGGADDEVVVTELHVLRQDAGPGPGAVRAASTVCARTISEATLFSEPVRPSEATRSNGDAVVQALALSTSFVNRCLSVATVTR